MRTRRFLKFLFSAPCLAVLGYAAVSGLAWWGVADQLADARLMLRGAPAGGADLLSSDEVLRAATAVEGRSFLDGSCAEELRGSLAGSPRIKDVTVARAHEGRLVARVRLREPLCRVEGVVLDDEAVVLPASRAGARVSGLVLIKGCSMKHVAPGERWPGADVVGAVNVARGLKDVACVREVRIRREGGKVSYVGVLSSGATVMWGESGDAEAKVKKLSRALAAVERSGRRASYIDLRFSRPVFNLAEGG